MDDSTDENEDPDIDETVVDGTIVVLGEDDTDEDGIDNGVDDGVGDSGDVDNVDDGGATGVVLRMSRDGFFDAEETLDIEESCLVAKRRKL